MSHYGPGRDWVRRCVAVCGRPRSDKIFAPRSTVRTSIIVGPTYSQAVVGPWNAENCWCNCHISIEEQRGQLRGCNNQCCLHRRHCEHRLGYIITGSSRAVECGRLLECGWLRDTSSSSFYLRLASQQVEIVIVAHFTVLLLTDVTVNNERPVDSIIIDLLSNATVVAMGDRRWHGMDRNGAERSKMKQGSTCTAGSPVWNNSVITTLRDESAWGSLVTAAQMWGSSALRGTELGHCRRNRSCKRRNSDIH